MERRQEGKEEYDIGGRTWPNTELRTWNRKKMEEEVEEEEEEEEEEKEEETRNLESQRG